MATDNVFRVCPCPVQLCNDALLRPGVLDREGGRHWSATVDLFHVGFLRLFPSPLKRISAASSSLLSRSMCILIVSKTDGVCGCIGGPPDCFCIRALTQSMGERGPYFGMWDVLMYRSECVANKPDEQEWQDRWVKCSTTVRLEPPHAPPPHSVGRENFQG